MEYDAKVIEHFAAGLYQHAAKAIREATALGCFLGAVPGLPLGVAEMARANDSLGGLVLAATCIAVGGYFGRQRGRARAFMLRLQAQEAMCQVQIERNTRRSA